MWRVAFGVAAPRQLAAVQRFGLWESPCGLRFFDPMVAGDASFYDDCYGRLGDRGPWTGLPVERSDYLRVAHLIKPGESVLDVGCGPAGFARHVPHARYVGLDQSAAARVSADVRCEAVSEHAATHAGEYDAVCSFHVVEHVAEPARFVADMVRCLRPGGRLVVAVPSWPSALTDIPNFALNGPPHHLSWWTPKALETLAETLGLSVASVEYLPKSPKFSLLYWMGWAAPKFTRTRYFNHAPAWYFALLWSWVAGRVCDLLFSMPPRFKSYELLLIARKPISGDRSPPV